MKKSLMKKIYSMLDKRQKLNFVLIIFIMIVSAVLSQLLPISIGKLTDDILTDNNLVFINILPFLLFILVITVSNEVIKVLRRVIVEDTCTACEKNARRDAVYSLLHAPLDYFKENMTGNIHGKLNRSLEGTIRLLKLLFMDFAPAIFSGVAAIIVIFTKLPLFLSFLMLLVIPTGVMIVFRQITTQKGIRVELLEEKSSMDGVMVELMNGIEFIRVTNSSDYEVNRFYEKSTYLRHKEMKHHKAMAFYDCLKFVNEAVFTVLVIGVSSYLAGEGVISVGTVLTSYLCFLELVNPLRELHRILDELSESTVLAEEFFKITDLEKDFSYYPKVKRRGLKKNSLIEFKNVSFSYKKGKKKIIDNLSLKIKEGEFIGVAGPSGCGKTSLIKMITKLEEVSSGDVTINNININSLSRRDISKNIAIVMQNPFLFAGTVKDNVCYGINRKVSMREIEEACRCAYIDDFIKTLPDGYNMVLAEGGSNLSGGQRQRIAIARIFLRKPKILILDEATSALDNTSEKYIQKEIERIQKEENITIICIAHRLTTLKNCDNILVFDKGKIVESGKYNSLIRRKGIFKDMYEGKIK